MLLEPYGFKKSTIINQWYKDHRIIHLAEYNDRILTLKLINNRTGDVGTLGTYSDNFEFIAWWLAAVL